MEKLTLEKLKRMPGAVVICRWRHCPGFGKEPIIRAGRGIVRTTGDVYASDRRSTIELRLENLGKTWEVRRMTAVDLDGDAKWDI